MFFYTFFPLKIIMFIYFLIFILNINIVFSHEHEIILTHSVFDEKSYKNLLICLKSFVFPFLIFLNFKHFNFKFTKGMQKIYRNLIMELKSHQEDGNVNSVIRQIIYG